MATIDLNEGDILHNEKEAVSAIEILLKGQIVAENEHSRLLLSPGSLIGAFEQAGDVYQYTYRADEASSVYEYPCQNAENLIGDMENAIRQNPKHSVRFVGAAIEDTAALYEEYRRIRKAAISEHTEILSDYQEYEELCEETGRHFIPSKDVEGMEEAPEDRLSSDWKIRYMLTFAEKRSEIVQHFFPIDQELCIGSALFMFKLMSDIVSETKKCTDYLDWIRNAAAEFRSRLRLIKTSLGQTEESEEAIPDFDHSLEVILSYGKMGEEFSTHYKELLENWKNAYDKNAVTEEMRVLRKELSSDFYILYEKVFLETMREGDEPPHEVEMFLTFGYLDKELAGQGNTEFFYHFCCSYEPDPQEHVYTMYDWLKRIYHMMENPSKSTFDNDYFEDLEEKVKRGDLERFEAVDLRNNRRARVSFEIHNIFESAHRLTSGHISTFVPFFDKSYVFCPLGKSLVTPDRIQNSLDRLRNIDPSCFCRTAMTSFPRYNINSFIYHSEVIPKFLLMPIVGSIAMLWQEIDGKVRTSPGRMVCPIFYTENLNDCVTKLAGTFRWEMCKREQGIHWLDVRDPSLTSRYSDYLQFYKKNREITPEARERIKQSLIRARNNYRNMFVFDYLNYINYESTGSPRLNKVAREILFEFCFFSREIREKLSTSPQYQRLIEKHENKSASIRRVLSISIQRIEQEGGKIPKEMKWEKWLEEA